MLRNFVAALLLLCIGGLQLAYADRPEVGVWTGTLGQQAIVACFDPAPSPADSDIAPHTHYFYERYGKLIKLKPIPNKAGSWLEAGETTSSGGWNVRLVAKDKLEGQWNDLSGKRTAPLLLKRFKSLSGLESDPSSVCNRLVLSSIFGVQPQSFSAHTMPDSKQYRVISVLDGAVESLKLVGEGDGIAALNERLANQQKLEIADYFDCATQGELPTPASVKKSKADFWSSVKVLFRNELPQRGQGRKRLLECAEEKCSV